MGSPNKKDIPITKVFVALPAMNEYEYLPKTIEDIAKQDYPYFELFVCVNQADEWWDRPEKHDICLNNAKTLDYLNSLQYPWLHILNNSSKGKGWTGNTAHVGTARRTIMEAINKLAQPDDILLSLDADTHIQANYFSSVVNIFEKNPKTVALSNPYYHPLSENDEVDRAMLRYEVYMRHYALNLKRIGSPYCFTALGSAIAVPAKAYRAIGGITPKKSGEDFYFLQKLRKYGWIETNNTIKVYPASRFSDRVFFGTGPALIKGASGNWDSYPIYDYKLFDNILLTYQSFKEQFTKTVPTPISPFLKEIFGEEDIFGPLRKNASTLENFIRACHHKIDGLRILQYLKTTQSLVPFNDEDNLRDFCFNFLKKYLNPETETILRNINFKTSSIEDLNTVRDFLEYVEYNQKPGN